jgi:hypothetical protein
MKRFVTGFVAGESLPLARSRHDRSLRAVDVR